MKKFFKIWLSVLLIAACLCTSLGISAEPKLREQYLLQNPQVTKTANNNYDIALANETIHVGNPKTTGSFIPLITIPRNWGGTGLNTSIGLSMAVAGNAIASTYTSSSSTSTSITASNSYMSLTYSAVPLKQPYNEFGGLDLSITLSQSVGTQLSFAYNNSNVVAYQQPSLTKEYTVGQTIRPSITVATVTDTDVVGSDGKTYVHRPDYIVNSIAFFNTNFGNTVTIAQANAGLTTGKIGHLYRLKMTGANSATGWADWSISGNTLILTLNTAGLTYPINITPVGDAFGYQTAGGTATWYNADQTMGSVFTATGSGTGTSITYSCTRDASPSVYTKGFVVLASGLTIVSNSVGDASLAAVGQSWITSTLSGSPSLTGSTNYGLMCVASAGAGNFALYYDGGATNQGIADYVNSYTTPQDLGSVTYSTNQYSIYVTYTPAGGSPQTYSPTGQSGNWTNPTQAYSSDNNYATFVGTSHTTTSSLNPTADTNGTYPWTNPNQGYTSENSYATAVATIPTWRATGTMAHAAAGSTITPGLPASMSANDVCIMYAVCYTGGTLAITTNGSIGTWNALTGSPIDVTAGDKLYIWWGVFSSGTTAPVITGTTPDHLLARIVAYSNVNTTSPIDVSATGTETTSDTSFSFATGLTTNYSNEIIICITSTTFDPTSDSTTAFATMTNANLTSIAERADNDINEGNGGGAAFDQGLLATAGAVGTWACTYSAGSSPKAYISFALKNKNPGNVFDQIYTTFGISGSATITKVEIGYEAFATATQKLNIYTSADGGSTWSTTHLTANLATSDPNSYTYIDVTADQTWTFTLLNNTNFKIKVVTQWINGTPTWSIDALITRVTYFDITNCTQSYTTYGISLAGNAISKVEVGIEAYAASSETVNLDVSKDNGSTWSTAQTSSALAGADPNTTTWFDFTSYTTWTPTLLADGTFQARIKYNDSGSLGTVSLDYIPVRITYVAISITNAPTTKDFGIVKPLTTYYAKGTAPSNPVVVGDCTFTITNNATSTVSISLSCTNFTGGTTWTLVSGTPAGDQIKVTAYYVGQNPASGLVLTTSNQAFNTIAGSGTLLWDFQELTGGQTNTFSDSTQKTATITITGS